MTYPARSLRKSKNTAAKNRESFAKKPDKKRNSKRVDKETIVAQMNEPRPLPMGRQEFEEWSNRIISGALIQPNVEEDKVPGVLIESQKFALANMLMHLGPTESHKPDAHFIHSLRKYAINQVADAVRKELHEAAKARTAAEEALKTDEQKASEGVAEATLLRIGKGS